MKNRHFLGILHRFVTTLREVVSNVFFIIILILIAVFVQLLITNSKATKIPSLPHQFTLVIIPKIVKEEISSPNMTKLLLSNNTQNPEESIHDITKSIRLAKNDPRVQAIWLDLSNFMPSGFGIVEEMYQALEEFKDSGKPIYTYAYFYTKFMYYIASLADEVWLDPFGKIEINGFSGSQIFMANALKELGVEANVIKAGEYKTAVEGFELDQRSESNERMTKVLLGSIWDHYLSTILENRPHLTEEQKLAIANPSLENRLLANSEAESAVKLGLVDHIGRRNQAWQAHISNATLDIFNSMQVPRSQSAVSHQDYLQLHESQQKRKSNNFPLFGTTPTIAVIHANGEIVSGYGNENQMGSRKVIEQVQAAVQDNVQAIVLRLNSPGGSADASEEIYQVLMAVRDQYKIPVVISMGDMAASGAYWISLAGDEVIAHPTTMTGSIGVFILFFTAENFAQKWGINDDIITVPANNLSWESFLRTPTREFLAYYQATTNMTYEIFLQKLVDAGRASTLEEANKLAQGYVYSGLQAKELGLIDDLGHLQTAITRAASLSDSGSKYQVKFYSPASSALEQLAHHFLNQSQQPLDIVLSRLGLSSEILENNPTSVYAMELMRIQ